MDGYILLLTGAALVAIALISEIIYLARYFRRNRERKLIKNIYILQDDLKRKVRFFAVSLLPGIFIIFIGIVILMVRK